VGGGGRGGGVLYKTLELVDDTRPRFRLRESSVKLNDGIPGNSSQKGGEGQVRRQNGAGGGK